MQNPSFLNRFLETVSEQRFGWQRELGCGIVCGGLEARPGTRVQPEWWMRSDQSCLCFSSNCMPSPLLTPLQKLTQRKLKSPAQPGFPLPAIATAEVQT